MNSQVISIILLLFAVYVLFKHVIFASPVASDPLSKTAKLSEKQTPVLEGKFTPQTLYKFNGFDDPKIYLGVKGKVYDVSSGRLFYGPSGPYSNFGGHDASRGLLKNSFDIEMITPWDKPMDTLSDLTELEWASLNGWEEHFQNKYTCVGVLCNPDEI